MGHAQGIGRHPAHRLLHATADVGHIRQVVEIGQANVVSVPAAANTVDLCLSRGHNLGEDQERLDEPDQRRRRRVGARLEDAAAGIAGNAVGEALLLLRSNEIETETWLLVMMYCQLRVIQRETR